MTRSLMTRRNLLATAAATVGTGALGQTAGSTEFEAELDAVDRNISSFRTVQWQDHFSNLNGGAILCDMESRAVHFWSADGGTYRLYPSSVPLTEDLTRRGRTQVIDKVEGPSWRPTPSMRERNPEWPEFVGPGPDNPLGTHALYLSWQYYRIHGTHDTRKIGRRSSNGCIGLYNEHIAELFALTGVGAQVILL